jgi:hypothetical protein
MAQPDPFAELSKGRTTIAETHAVITPADGADLPFYPKAVVCGATAGTVVVTDKAGVDATYWLEAGQTLPIRPVRIKATGTTATPLIGLKE